MLNTPQKLQNMKMTAAFPQDKAESMRILLHDGWMQAHKLARLITIMNQLRFVAAPKIA